MTLRMLRALIFLPLLQMCLSLPSVGAEPSKILAHLPNTGVNAVQVDAAGDIYVAGYQGRIGTPASYDGFLAKLSPDGSQTLFSVKLGGSQQDEVLALALDSAGAAYVFGITQSTDFPVTAGAFLSTLPAGSQEGFVAKVDPSGTVVYATLFGAGSTIQASPASLFVDAAGEAIISGVTEGGTFPSKSSAPFMSTDVNTTFVLKLDPRGAKILGAVRGIGGVLATDAEGNIYVAGTAQGGTTIPLTVGAYQSRIQLNGCGGTAQLGLGCSYQYVTKLNNTLTQIVYSTYVAGSYGATPSAIFVDSQGDALLAGSTNSPDYPTTSNAFQPIYLAAAPPGPQVNLFGTIYPPPASGYVTQLNPSGTALLYSTFFSGTLSDSIGFAALTSSGIYLSGQAGSPDLPALQGIPLQCMPLTFETRLSLDGQTLTSTHEVPGAVLAYDAHTSALLSWTGSDLISFNPAAPPNHIACILDAADLQPVTSIAPGELLSIFGADFINGTFSQISAPFPTSISSLGFAVTVNGVNSPLLYVSPQQINVQAPYEIGGASQATIVLTSALKDVSESNILSVVPRNPVAFLDTVTSRSSVDLEHCTLNGGVYSGGPLPLAFNSDGSRNTCFHPASPGSVVTIFLAGLGLTIPAPVTGAVNTAPAVPLNLPITFSESDAILVSATATPGSISGVWTVQIRISADDLGAVPVSLSVGSVAVRDTNLTIWVQ
jgi:uncharacterized protein (TIGR03437 family)